VSDTSLFAHWAHIPAPLVAVTLSGNGGIPATQTVMVPMGTSFEAIFAQVDIPVRNWFDFVGWSLHPADMVPPSEVIAEDTTLFAHWAIPVPRSAVAFLGNGGTPAMQTVSVPVGTPFEAIFAQVDIPMRDGFDFVGWSLHPADMIRPSEVIAKDTTLFAHWAYISISWVEVTLSGVGGTPNIQTVFVPAGTSFEEVFAQAETPIRDRFEFAGWSLHPVNMVYPGSVVMADTRLFALWTAQSGSRISAEFQDQDGSSDHRDSDCELYAQWETEEPGECVLPRERSEYCNPCGATSIAPDKPEAEEPKIKAAEENGYGQ